MKYDIDWLFDEINGGAKFEYIFFWGGKPSAGGRITKTCLSQWFPCRFECDGALYFTAEQYMMAQKAVLFGDSATHARIMSASHTKAIQDVRQKNHAFR